MKIPSWQFGDTKKEADRLLALVLKRKKTATSSLYDSYRRKNIPLPQVGNKNFIEDSKGIKRCLIITTNVKIKPFTRITKTFAKKEGEGDLSLAHWRETHTKFFEKRFKKWKMKWDDTVLVVCEEFRILKLFPHR